MNDETRAALVEELAAALYQHDSDKHGIVRLAWDVPVGPRTDALKDDFRETAQGLMPIINRLLAERDMDALLDGLHPDSALRYVERGRIWSGEYKSGEYKWFAGVDILNAETHMKDTSTGTGPTRIAAIRAAVAKAKGEPR